MTHDVDGGAAAVAASRDPADIRAVAEWSHKAMLYVYGLSGTGGATTKAAAHDTASTPLHIAFDSLIQLLEPTLAEYSQWVSSTLVTPELTAAQHTQLVHPIDHNAQINIKRAHTAAHLTALLQFAAAQAPQQTNQKKVFSTCCSRLMQPILQIAASADAESDSHASAEHAALILAGQNLLSKILFHRDHLDGFQSVFANQPAVVPDASIGSSMDVETAATTAVDGTAAAADPADTSKAAAVTDNSAAEQAQLEQPGKKRKRHNKKAAQKVRLATHALITLTRVCHECWLSPSRCIDM